MSERLSHAFCPCRRVASALALAGAALLLFGCSTPMMRVEVPPRVNLHAWPLIGVVDFTTNAYPPLGKEATQRFIQNLEAAQPGARLLELGTGDQILRDLHRSSFDPGTIRAMGDRYGVAAVLIGHLHVSGMTPDLHLSPSLKSFSAAAKVNSDLSAKLLETATGATVWSGGAHGKWSLGGVRYHGGNLTDLHYTDPSAQYQKMIDELARVATDDFRPTYEERPVNR
jgi:hypothetical protein